MKTNTDYFIKWLKDLRFQISIGFKFINFSLLFVHIVLIQRYCFAIILPKYGFVITTEDAYYLSDHPKQKAWIWKKEIWKFKIIIGKFYGSAWDIV